jgi:hypothetical protein
MRFYHAALLIKPETNEEMTTCKNMRAQTNANTYSDGDSKPLRGFPLDGDQSRFVDTLLTSVVI